MFVHCVVLSVGWCCLGHRAVQKGNVCAGGAVQGQGWC